MFSIVRAIIDRLKTLFATRAAMELEAEVLAQDAERRAELLRLATRYEKEGLSGIALQLRQRVEQLDDQRPLAGVLPVVAHLQANPAQPLEHPRLESGQSTPMLRPPRNKGGKS